MKLLFDATILSYAEEKSGHRAGVFNVAENILEEMEKAGIDIALVCDYRRYYFLKSCQKYKRFKLLEEHNAINKLIGRLFILIDKLPLRLKYAFIIFFRFYDKYLYRTNKANLHQLKQFDAYFSPYNPPVKEIEQADLKRFRMLHDVIPIIENGMPKSPKDWYFKIYNSINKNDFYIANSEYTKSDVLKYFSFINNDNIITSPLGASEHFYPQKENSPINDKYVFSLCSLGKRKNLEFIIKNFFAFIQKHNITDLKLVLGGDIWKKYEKSFNRFLSEYDKSKLILTGYIDDSDLRAYYSNALFFVYPSLYEGFGLPVLEAMRCGCPVICSDTTSLPEVIGDTGIKINPKDDEGMIQAIERMYFDNIFRALCSERGIERAKNFSWKKCTDNIINFIQSKL